MNWMLFELEAQMRSAEAERRRHQPRFAEAPPLWPAARQSLAEALVAIGLRLDPEASRAAIRSADPTPRLNGSDA
jgi:hypothetical protein